MYFTYEMINSFLAFLCSVNLHFGYSVSVMRRTMTKMQCVTFDSSNMVQLFHGEDVREEYLSFRKYTIIAVDDGNGIKNTVRNIVLM